ncbi:MAG: glycosyltransferase [Lachnospiraceae bacterium]|nr:glycosyltransferase [Lachnospiraceae bacterium]
MTNISIVLPTYNGEQYLSQAIDSILAQTCTDWELILVDDCSVDRTLELAEQYAASDERIRVIHNTENQKLPRSLNIGFSAAKGRYLTWTSDDNRYMPEALATMSEYLDRNPTVAMVQSRMEFIDAEGNRTGCFEAYSDETMYFHNCMGACFLYRREAADAVGEYDTDTFCVEDYDYWLRVLERFGKVATTGQVLYQYRRHGGSLSEQKKKQVREQLTRLRIRYADSIFHALKDRPKDLCCMYYEMQKSESMTTEMLQRFQRALPDLQREVPLRKDRNYIIFGAGIYGERARRALGEQAAFFADNDWKKIGTYKFGLEILSFQDAIQLTGKYGFLIAIAEERIYEMMIQLRKAGVEEYSVFQRHPET